MLLIDTENMFSANIVVLSFSDYIFLHTLDYVNQWRLITPIMELIYNFDFIIIAADP